MPHLNLDYSRDLAPRIGALCDDLAALFVAFADADGTPAFKPNGLRLHGRTLDHCFVAGAQPGNAALTMVLRLYTGRPKAFLDHLGQALQDIAARHLAGEAVALGVLIEEVSRTAPGPIILVYEGRSMTAQTAR